MSTIIKVPQINPNDISVQVVSWIVTDGASVTQGQDIGDLETSKATVTIQAEQSGIIRLLVPVGDVVDVGDPLYSITGSEDDRAAASALEPASIPDSLAISPTAQCSDIQSRKPDSFDLVDSPAPPAIGLQPFNNIRFSKAAKSLLNKLSLSETAFAGCGLVTVDMVRALHGGEDPARPTSIAGPRKPLPTPAATQQPKSTGVSTLRSIAPTLSKKAEITSLSIGESGNINSTLTIYFDSADIRERLRSEGLFDGAIQPIVLFELSRLLKQWPQFTAFFHDDRIHYYDRVDIGLAVDLGKGLKVITIAGADQMKPADLFQATIDIGLRYLENNLNLQELSGSTITVTDVSAYDILHFHPLINGNQSAIIGIGGDSTQPGHPMSISMTFDHRVSTGRDVAAFLHELRARVESYAPRRTPKSMAGAGKDAPILSQTAIIASCCDFCGIDTKQYYELNPRDGVMKAYFRPDGSLGAACYLCAEGWN